MGEVLHPALSGDTIRQVVVSPDRSFTEGNKEGDRGQR